MEIYRIAGKGAPLVGRSTKKTVFALHLPAFLTSKPLLTLHSNSITRTSPQQRTLMLSSLFQIDQERDIHTSPHPQIGLRTGLFCVNICHISKPTYSATDLVKLLVILKDPSCKTTALTIDHYPTRGQASFWNLAAQYVERPKDSTTDSDYQTYPDDGFTELAETI